MRTLTEMLEEDMLDPYPKPDAANKVKEIVKEWLRTVNLPSHYLTVEEGVTELLVTLVDEP